jgi:hypothetical protein
MLTSIGRLTNNSTSSGANPAASVITVTVGRFKSGNTSFVILDITQVPITPLAKATNKTIARFRREYPINQSNIASHLSRLT